MSLSRITNAKWKVLLKVPSNMNFGSNIFAKLLNQPLFFLALQARHEEMLPDANPNAIMWSFVKNQMETKFTTTGNIQPMFHRYKSTDEKTMIDLKGKSPCIYALIFISFLIQMSSVAIQNAKNNDLSSKISVV